MTIEKLKSLTAMYRGILNGLYADLEVVSSQHTIEIIMKEIHINEELLQSVDSKLMKELIKIDSAKRRAERELA